MIRPLHPGDLVLVQRLNRQAAKFHTVRTLLESHSVLGAALSSLVPASGAKVATYVLRQDGHGLVHSGFLQVQKRHACPAADVLCLAPGLDAPAGHPATWTKLLAAYLHDVTAQGILRIYADVPDQPLPVTTLSSVGFQTYARQTIWRLFTPTVESYSHLVTATIRPKVQADEWGLTQLYLHTVPEHVQQAEGWLGLHGDALPILTGWVAEHGSTFVMVEGLHVVGALQAATGRNGSWLQWWADMRQPDNYAVQQMLCFGLSIIRANNWRTPVYLAVADYHGGLSGLLGDYGFAPFSDRVQLVKQMAKWVRESTPAAATVMEPVSEVVPTSFAPGGQAQPAQRRQVTHTLPLQRQVEDGRGS